MALMKNEEEEPTLPAKRKSDLVAEGIDIDANESTTKKQKSEEEHNSSVPEEKKVINEEEDEEDYEGHNDDVEEEEESEDEEAQIDRKGKGIMKDDKGKGKLIEESDELSDDDDDGDEEEEDSDLSDDPLAEVDLDNILPSRTRRGVARPGLSIGNDLVPKDNNGTDV